MNFKTEFPRFPFSPLFITIRSLYQACNRKYQNTSITSLVIFSDPTYVDLNFSIPFDKRTISPNIKQKVLLEVSKAAENPSQPTLQFS